MGKAVDPVIEGGDVCTAAVRSDLEDVNCGIAAVEQAITRHFAAAQPDKFGRVPAEMPDSIRALYTTGTWCRHEVYMWDLVVNVAADGHAKAKAAHDNLARLSFRPVSGSVGSADYASVPPEHSTAVADAVVAGNVLGDQIKRVIEDRRAKRKQHLKQLYLKYRGLQKAHLWRLREEEEMRSPEMKEAILKRDRLLVMATRASAGMGGGMSTKEIDTSFEEVQKAGGTAGGLSRWGSSLATIPNQDPTYCPLDRGILIYDPLAAHYAAKNVNPWTRAERLLFLEKFLSHNKNFRRIATFFEHKSVDDVVRFYFDNKKPLKLKQLTRDAQLKKRTTKKNALVELSRLPTESRSIANNFAGDAEWFGSDDDVRSRVSCSPSTDIRLPRDAGADWSPGERQSLIFALCRNVVEDDLGEFNDRFSLAWCRIARGVSSKTPAQCRRFYVQYRSALGLDKYQPLQPLAKASAPKRIRGIDDTVSREGNDRGASRRKLTSFDHSVENGAGTSPSSTQRGAIYADGATGLGLVSGASDFPRNAEDASGGVLEVSCSGKESSKPRVATGVSTLENNMHDVPPLSSKAQGGAHLHADAAKLPAMEPSRQRNIQNRQAQSSGFGPLRNELAGLSVVGATVGSHSGRFATGNACLSDGAQTSVEANDTSTTGPSSGEVLAITAVTAPGPEPVT
jgi:hypothetical protein